MREPLSRIRDDCLSSAAGVVGTSAETLPFLGKEHSAGDGLASGAERLEPS
jgi:hypothetical protein